MTANNTTPERPKGFGIACMVAWTELVNAMREDGHRVHQSSGPNTRKWIEGVVAPMFTAPEPITPKCGAVNSVLEIVARYVGRTSGIYKYIRDDLEALAASATPQRGDAEWSRRMAEMERGQTVTAGAHGIPDEPQRTDPPAEVWSVGSVLHTANTRRLSPEQLRDAEMFEACCVFSGFSAVDHGRSRRLVAKCDSPEIARQIVAAHNRADPPAEGLEASEYEYRNQSLPNADGQRSWLPWQRFGCYIQIRRTARSQTDAEGREWVLVPREPTDKMLEAGWDAGAGDSETASPNFSAAYAAMLAARPQPEDRKDG